MNLWEQPFFQFLDFAVRIKKTPLSGIIAEAGLSVGGLLATRQLEPPPIAELEEADLVAQNFGEPGAIWYGRRLFEWLFDEDLRDAFLRARQLAPDDAGERRLRTRIFIDPGLPALHKMRWETLLYRKDDWLWSTQTAFARAAEQQEAAPRFVTERPLRVLAAATIPQDRHGFGGWDVEALTELFDREIKRPLGALFHVTSPPVGPLTFERFAEAIGRADKLHLIILLAQAEPGEDAPQLIFVDASGRPVPVSWSQVAQLIGKRPPVFVALVLPTVAASWDPARPPPLYAEKLLASGCRAILELHGPITQPQGMVFLREFLPTLARTGMLDVSVARARGALRASESQRGWGWTFPILSLRDPRRRPPVPSLTRGL